MVAFYSMDGSSSINQWSRATNAVSIVHRDTDVEGYYDVSGRPRASNAGGSFSRQWYKDAADITGWAVSVRNPAGTFRVADDSRDGVLSLVSYDIDRTGRRAVVSVSDGREGFIHIVDRSIDPRARPQRWPPCMNRTANPRWPARRLLSPMSTTRRAR